MKVRLPDAVAFAGHQIHLCRYREAAMLLRWLGADLRGLRVLDVAGGDGYWAGQAGRRGARGVSIDLSRAKMTFGKTLAHRPALLEADALALPFADATFDRVMSMCAIEHFDDGERAIDEMTRVLAPGGELVISADALTGAARWPKLYHAHATRYSVKRTYTHKSLAELLAARGFEVVEHTYQFRARWSERLYLGLSASGRRLAFNAAAGLIPFVALSDRWAGGDGGSIVLVRARHARAESILRSW